MRVLVVGSGGREHAIAWKISQSKKVKKLFVAPGNAGIAKVAECANIKADDVSALADFAVQKKVDLTVVGPEAPLAKGIVDAFQSKGLHIFGPRKDSAQIEASKVFAKKLMKKYGIPTADFAVFDDKEKALDYVQGSNGKLVVKAEGLAAGKGVLICENSKEASAAIEKIMGQKAFGEAGNRVVIEEFLEGEEASIIGFSDGKTVQLLPSSQDHKRAFDGDKGPNTGGMGAYSPAPIVTKKLENFTLEKIMLPTIEALRKEASPYVGVLYAGLMITKDGPKVLEYNCRFGDPEAQAVIPRMQGDMVEIIEKCMSGELRRVKMKVKKQAATCVVLASGGYPEHYEIGKTISGLEQAGKMKNVVVFHSGTAKQNGKIVTNGGRVLGVTGLGSSIKSSIETAYKAVKKMSFEKMHYRTDIGQKALGRK